MSHNKLSKYCDIDARLANLNLYENPSFVTIPSLQGYNYYILSVAYLGFHFGGGVQNFSGKVGVFAWREAPCSAWRNREFARGFGGMLPRENFKNGAIWCVLESILLKFCQKNK